VTLSLSDILPNKDDEEHAGPPLAQLLSQSQSDSQIQEVPKDNRQSIDYPSTMYFAQLF
jgi:hypothetical protein